MTDIRAILLSDTSRRQGRIGVAAGDAFMRGQRVAIVSSVDGDSVTWIAEEEGEVTTSRAEFRARALEGVSLGSQGAFLDRAWQIARARNLAAGDRLIVLRGMLDRAPSREDGEVLAGWMGAISMGSEPIR
jgi:hypothetical protein